MINTPTIHFYAPDGTMYPYSKICSATAKKELENAKRRSTARYYVVVKDCKTQRTLHVANCCCLGEANCYVNNWRQHAPQNVTAQTVKLTP